MPEVPRQQAEIPTKQEIELAFVAVNKRISGLLLRVYELEQEIKRLR